MPTAFAVNIPVVAFIVPTVSLSTLQTTLWLSSSNKGTFAENVISLSTVILCSCCVINIFPGINSTLSKYNARPQCPSAKWSNLNELFPGRIIKFMCIQSVLVNLIIRCFFVLFIKKLNILRSPPLSLSSNFK